MLRFILGSYEDTYWDDRRFESSTVIAFDTKVKRFLPIKPHWYKKKRSFVMNEFHNGLLVLSIVFVLCICCICSFVRKVSTFFEKNAVIYFVDIFQYFFCFQHVAYALKALQLHLWWGTQETILCRHWRNYSIPNQKIRREYIYNTKYMYLILRKIW